MTVTQPVKHSRLVSVVIVNYFSEGLAARCMRSICEAEPSPAGKIEFVIVDNGSNQEWPSLLEGMPKISLIGCGDNLGFAQGANRGIRAANGGYIFLINPDSLVCRSAISRAVAYMEEPANKTVAILGPRVYDDLEKRSVQLSARGFPGFSQALFNRYSLLTRFWPSNPWSRRYLKSEWHHSTPARVDWVSGCCMLIRRSALDQIGLFDERYFMYIEDVDLCRRAWANGWEVVQFPGSEVVHLIGGSSGRRPIRLIVEHHRSMWVYYLKFFHAGMAARALVFLGICARGLVAVISSWVNLGARRLAGLRTS